MTNTLTVDQLQELLKIQKEFDDRIPTLNLEDSEVAYVVEFFEWFNTLETFKNWKKKPGKPLEVQLDELADMLAFSLSITNQMGGAKERHLVFSIFGDLDEYDYDNLLGILNHSLMYEKTVGLTIELAKRYYTIDDLIAAYKKKMERNHARQDGTADKEKGYV
ncbi:dUTPase [Staphylococcus pseudintermedius]|uniref:dUTPase n=1 Tax=Staphylococcus pseudintermedius TaxID=283734 RepID=UPI001121C5B9|nr:dUTPase [Staphylococcus pseudintermedius]EGQ0369471.1 dUTPase [Staphylococcus pseudintermedius]EGQ2732618.1 dUTPase [Staphylococcus pseudintermedius]EGQ2966275.1 dUTPase [Staphylococcus pseudintermedius]EGQ3460962.1 dUTPase [Staphylococcus pseudintermedius]EGQ3763627.1 dUTPase [Staphylococcus pseudintermedius]